MTKNKRRARPQKQKDKVQRVQDLRRGSTAQPHALATDYKRSPKHKGRGWEDA